MNFRQRFLRYGLGVAIGCVIVYMMFPNHDWLGWLPGKQIMRQIQECKMHVTPHAQCRLECQGLSTTNFNDARYKGEVDFASSDTKSSPKRYLLLHESTEYIILLTDSTVTLAEVKLPVKKDCNCH